jgi:hypothetical protein
MEINPWGVLIVFLLLYVIGVLAALLIITLLASLNLVRVKHSSHILLWSLAGSILLNIIFWGVKCGFSSRNNDGIITAPSIKDSAAIK